MTPYDVMAPNANRYRPAPRRDDGELPAPDARARAAAAGAAAAVFAATGAQQMGGKVLSAVMFVSLFVVLGYEHSVANMFLIPQARRPFLILCFLSV